MDRNEGEDNVDQKVVDKKTDKVLFIGTYKQSITAYTITGKIYEYTWEDRIDGGDQIR